MVKPIMKPFYRNFYDIWTYGFIHTFSLGQRPIFQRRMKQAQHETDQRGPQRGYLPGAGAAAAGDRAGALLSHHFPPHRTVSLQEGMQLWPWLLVIML